eukprot:6060919-Lingulodinium_polyedra.AAC.1
MATRWALPAPAAEERPPLTNDHENTLECEQLLNGGTTHKRCANQQWIQPGAAPIWHAEMHSRNANVAN